MSAKPKLGLTSYSYHLAASTYLKESHYGREGVSWLLDQVKALDLDGVQLGGGEVDIAQITEFRTGGDRERYLEVAMGTWTDEELRQWLGVSRDAGARGLRAMLSYEPLAWTHFEEDRAMLMRHLEKAATMAEEFGVPLALENHSDYAAWQIAELLRDLQSPHVGVCFDSGNPPSSFEHPVDAARSVAPFVYQTHLRDFKIVHADYGIRYEGVPLGQGVVDVEEVVRILRAESPAEAFSVESAVRADPRKSAEENLQYEEEGARQSIEFARTRLGL